MNKRIKKTLLSLGAVATVATPIAAVVSCGNPDTTVKFVEYNGGALTAADTYFVTDGGSVTDKSFNESGYDGWLAGGGKDISQNKAGHVLKPTDSGKIAEKYNTVKSKGGKLIVAMGFNHGTALRRFTEENPGIGVVFVDETLEATKTTTGSDGKKKTELVQQGNIVSIKFKTEQAAFLAGVSAAHKATLLDKNDPKVGVFGGMDIYTVNQFIYGFKAGVKFYNANKTDKTQKDVVVEDAGYVGNFDAGGGTIPTQTLISKGVELILSVGGPQEFDVLAEIVKQGKTGSIMVIGVDTDMSAQVGSSKIKSIRNHANVVWDSIQKELKSETEKAVRALIADVNDSIYGFGKVVQTDLASGGVSVKNQAGLTAAVNAMDKNAGETEAAAKAFVMPSA